MSEERRSGSSGTREKDARRRSGGAEPRGSEPAGSGDRPTGEPDAALLEELRDRGWQWSPLVVHGDEVLGGTERYEAARFLGMDEEVPRITLEEVYAEAGMDFPQIAGPPEELDSQREFFEDYLRELPRHIQDKYGLGEE